MYLRCRFPVVGFLLTLVISFSPAFAQKRFANGWIDVDRTLERPIVIAHFEGSIEETMRAHGSMLAEIPEGKEVLNYYGSLLEKKLDEQPFSSVAKFFYRNFLKAPLLSNVPDRYREGYERFASAAGIDVETVWNALVLPDVALRSVSMLYGSEVAPYFLPNLSGFGCTSILWDAAPKSLLHGRNLDYEGVGVWNRYPLLLHVLPDEGLAYVSITALGIPAPGITGFNEEGLTLGVHQLTVQDTQASGTPVAVISAEILRQARNIDDAITLIKSYPRAGGWAYVISHGKERAVIETSAHEVGVRRSSERFFFQTNHVSVPALEKRQIFYSPGSWLDSFERADRLSSLAKTGFVKGWSTPEKMVGLLGDLKNKRVAGGTIAKLDNILSVVMNGSERKLWIGLHEPGADASPNHSPFVEFRWKDLRSPSPPFVAEGGRITSRLEERIGEKKARLRRLLRKAFAESHPGQSPKAGLEALDQYAAEVEASAKHAPLDGAWAGLLLGVMNEIKNGSTRFEQLKDRLDLALADEDLSKKTNPTPFLKIAAVHRRALARLLKGWLFDLSGKRADALIEYAWVAKNAPFGRLVNAAKSGLRAEFTASNAHRLAIDWPGVDLYRY